MEHTQSVLSKLAEIKKSLHNFQHSYSVPHIEFFSKNPENISNLVLVKNSKNQVTGFAFLDLFTNVVHWDISKTILKQSYVKDKLVNRYKKAASLTDINYLSFIFKLNEKGEEHV